jgi:hypothetical protein
MSTIIPKPSEILDSAAEIIERDGWYQGKYFKYDDESPKLDVAKEENRTAPCCQAGAISRAVWGVAWRVRNSFPAEGDVERWEAHQKAEDYTRRMTRTLTDHVEGSPIAYNDHPDRTARDVTDMLRGAAALARAAGE